MRFPAGFAAGIEITLDRVKIRGMNQSLKKTLLLCLIVLCGGFAVIGWMEADPGWVAWLIGFALSLSVYLFVFHPKKKTEKQPEITSILPEEAARDLAAGKVPNLKSDLKLRKNEKLLWSDQMRSDYYNTAPHRFYLTNERLVCLDEDFRFSHPLKEIIVEQRDNRLTLRVKKAKMTFLVASPQAFADAWKLTQKS